MAHRKAGGTARNLRDSNPKYLGTKLYEGQKAQPGSVIIRQRGTKIMAGTNVRTGKDHTLFSITYGIVKFGKKRVKHFDGTTVVKKVVHVIESEETMKASKATKALKTAKNSAKKAANPKGPKVKKVKAVAKTAAPKKKK